MISEREEKMAIKHRLFEIFQDRLESFYSDDERNNGGVTPLLIAHVTDIQTTELNLLNSFCIERKYTVAIKPDMFRLQLEFFHDVEDLK